MNFYEKQLEIGKSCLRPIKWLPPYFRPSHLNCNSGLLELHPQIACPNNFLFNRQICSQKKWEFMSSLRNLLPNYLISAFTQLPLLAFSPLRIRCSLLPVVSRTCPHQRCSQISYPEPLNMLFHYKRVIKVASPRDCKMDYPRLLSGSEVSQGPSILEKGGRRRELERSCDYKEWLERCNVGFESKGWGLLTRIAVTSRSWKIQGSGFTTRASRIELSHVCFTPVRSVLDCSPTEL